MIAHVLFYFHYSTFAGRSLYLEDIYVTPEYRNKGIASEMLQRLASVGHIDYEYTGIRYIPH